jgi:hypothetical protein
LETPPVAASASPSPEAASPSRCFRLPIAAVCGVFLLARVYGKVGTRMVAWIQKLMKTGWFSQKPTKPVQSGFVSLLKTDQLNYFF